jgi:hypothetical protein
MPPAQRAQIDIVAVIAQHHRQAGETAFSRLALADIGNRPTADQITHGDPPVALNRLRKNPDDPQYFGVSGTLRTLLVVLNLPFSAAC